ncbi:hypothetical protein [Frankia nepalensis]|uniref:Uncharacterized protein n=2 Tax=Frankia nepalensis TaxID=1836974 RepID=A0A937R9F2_9ACTN|nr:hypothetical protein [Frankia nepalensis]MBL7497967.1 hypothetical protein [Frankia nepalensis]MBL7627846.1 hypothetical protein [Frankia nepalensis]
MTIAQTAAASIGRLGLAAAAFGRPTPVGAERPGASGRGPAKTARGVRLNMDDSLFDLFVNAAVGAGWLSERRTLRGRSLANDAKVMVTVKDVLVAGTVLTGAATVVGEKVTRRHAPAGGSLSEEEPSPDAALDVDGNGRYLRRMTELNHAFALLAVATTPFINFALFDSYHPHPLRSFFSLW